MLTSDEAYRLDRQVRRSLRVTGHGPAICIDDKWFFVDEVEYRAAFDRRMNLHAHYALHMYEVGQPMITISDSDDDVQTKCALSSIRTMLSLVEA